LAETIVEGQAGADWPEGWTVTQLSNVCEINPPKPPKDFLPPNAPVSFVPMSAVDADQGAIVAPQTKAFMEVRKGFTSFRNDDVIMAKITPCMENGKVAITRNLTNGVGFGSTEFHVLRPTGAVLPEYIYTFIRQESYRRAAEAEMTGSVGQKRVPPSFLEMTEFPVPPLAEQVRIVEKVTELLNEVEASRERLNRVPRILKRFRQAVLLAAGSGRLTENWRSTYEPTESAPDLYNRAQQLRAEKYASDCESALSNGRRRPADPRKSERSGKQVVDLPEFPEQWGLYPLQDLAYLVTDGTHRTPTYLDKGIAFLSVKNVRPFRIRDEDIKRISPDEHREINLRCNPATGDILYTKVGATFGYAALNRLPYPFSLFVSVALLKPVQECFVPEYAEIILNSDIVYRQAADRVSGSGTPDLHLIEIRDFRIPLPPLDEQKEIVRCVNRLFELADAIGQRVARAQERTGRLTQSILAKAFRGDLLPTEAELARREGREYEPASVLLQRIKGERNSATPSTAKRTRSNGTLASAKGKA
jgi:type I restriction enzyme S subunit